MTPKEYQHEQWHRVRDSLSKAVSELAKLNESLNQHGSQIFIDAIQDVAEYRMEIDQKIRVALEEVDKAHGTHLAPEEAEG